MIESGAEARIIEAIQRAERKTRAEIVVVIARRCGAYRLFPLAWATLVALALPFALILATNLSAHRIALIQLAVFAALYGVLSIPAVTRLVTPASVQKRRAHGFALEQFWLRGVTRTSERVGVLVFCALGERVARVVADDGIGAHVTQEQWREAVTLIVEGAKVGQAGAGCAAAVEHCGDLLARDFPALPGDRDELANKVYLI